MSNPLRQRLPFHPLLACGIIGILLGHFTPWPSSVWLIATFASAALSFLIRRPPTLGLLILSVFATVHLWQSRESPGAEFARGLPSQTPATVIGIVSTEPRVFSASRSSFELRVSSLFVGGQERHPAITLLVNWPGQPPAYGDKLQIPGLLGPLDPPRNPGQFDFARWAALRGIYTRLEVNDPIHSQVLDRDQGNPLVVLALRTREWMRQTLIRGVDDPIVSNLLVGMVLGDVSEIPNFVQEQFRGTGTFHLFSVSGLHVSIVAVLFWTLCRVACLPRRIAVIATIGLVFFYVLITGLKPASVRSAIMAAIVLFGLMAERKPILLNNLLAAGFFILLANTNDLFNPGFQLSFCVVAAILLLANPLTALLEKPFQPDPFLPEKLLSAPRRALFESGKKVASLSAVSIAAWCGSLPLTLGYFHLVSLTALPANMVAVPVSFGIMSVGLLALGAGVIAPGLAAIYNQTNWLLTKILLASVSFFAALPGSFFYVRAPESAPSLAEIVVFDFGTGAATWVGSGGSDWLIDTGPSHTHDGILLPFLRSKGLRQLDGILLTQDKAQHAGAVADLIISCPPRLLLDALWSFRLGEIIPINSTCRIHVFAPPLSGKRRTAADDTTVLRLDVGETRILFLSDGGEFTEQWLLTLPPEDIRADILVKGSPRKGPQSSPYFLAAVGPRLIIAGSMESAARRKVSADLLKNAAALRIPLFRQDETGAVTIKIFPQRCEVSGFLNNQSFVFP